MANTRKPETAPVPEFTTIGKRAIAKADRMPFKIDGETFYLIRPKGSMLARAAMVMDSGVSMDDPKNMRAMMMFTTELIQYVDDEIVMIKGPDGQLVSDGLPHGRMLIERRLSDPKDALDVTDLLPMLTVLLNGWFGRPTGSPRASSAPRRAQPVARVSRARTPSTRART